MEFLETGEKIKKTRKELNMKQRDFEDINITRALISMIEIGKRTPNKENMENIIIKFRKRARELNVPFNLESSYFLRSAKEEAEIYCTRILSDSVSMDEIIAVIEIANKYGLSRIVSDAYLKLGDKMYEDLDYINSQIDFHNALEIYKELNIKDKIPYIYNMLGRCCVNQAQYIQALNYLNFAYHYSALYCDEEIKKKAIYNIALCNRKLGNIEDTLKYIDIYISICDKEKDFLVYSYAIILKSNCYDFQGDVASAIKVLNYLVDEFRDKTHPLIGNIYNNLGVLYCKQGDLEKSLQCFNISEKIRLEKDMQNLSHTLIEKSLLYIQQELYVDSIPIIKSAIKLATTYNDIEYILKGHYELVKIYKILKLDKEIKDSYIQMLNLLMNSGSENHKEEITKVCVELLRIFLLQNDIQQSIKILDMLENLSKK